MKKDIFNSKGEKVGEQLVSEYPITTHRTLIYLDEFFDLFTEQKDNAIHQSSNPKIKRAIRSLNYSKHRPFDVLKDRRVTALLSAAVKDGIITAGTRTTIKKGIPL